MPNAIIRFETSHFEPYPLEVQGESHYRKNLEAVSGHTGEDEGVDIDDIIAHMILDDNNINDPGNAVRVEIRGRVVGYLAKMAAKKYRKRLVNLGITNVTGECYASIRGGFIRADGGRADFGVRLDLDLDTFTPYVPRISTPIPASVPQPIQQVITPPVVAIPEVEDSTLSPVRRFFNWFFRPGKNRIWRIVLFILLVITVCFACTICFGMFLQMTNQSISYAISTRS